MTESKEAANNLVPSHCQVGLAGAGVPTLI